MYPPHIRQQLIDLVINDKMSALQAASAMSVSYRAARNWLRAAGVTLSCCRIGGTAEDFDALKARAVGLVDDGATRGEAAAFVGVGRHAVGRWCKDAEMNRAQLRQRDAAARLDDHIAALQQDIADADRSRIGRGRRLILAQRKLIALAELAGHTQRHIAELADTTPSTVSRELSRRRHHQSVLYDADDAHAVAEKALRRPRLRRLDANPSLRAEVIARLNQGWSPRLVALDLARCFGDDDTMTISGETIYQALYVQGRGALRQELTLKKALHTGRTRRKPRSMLPERRGAKSWVDGAHISQRPAEAEDRAVPGHWEGDLIIGAGQQSAIITLVERHSRYVMMRRLPVDHTSPTVIEAITEMIGALPAHLRRSLTWDQGAEMANHAEFTVATDCGVFFCDPHSPWQRGSNENTNGLIRRFLPKGTDFRDVTDVHIAEVERMLNTRPRETLNLMTPADKLNEIMGVAMTA